MNHSDSFSGHLLDSYKASQLPRGPFGQSLPISTFGPMSFAPQMHGSHNGVPGSQMSISSLSEMSFMDMTMTEDSAKKIATMQAKLDKKLGPEYISQRSGPGGAKLTYAEGWKIINLANEVFGFNGWSSNIVSITIDFMDYNKESQRWSVGVTAIVRVTLRDGAFHEDVGFGLLENSKSKGAALDKCKKEAVTDAVKRTLRNFGNVLGNCLYDKGYTQEVVKMKISPPKFDRDSLHRLPEFEQPNASGTAQTTSNASASSSSSLTATSNIKSESGHSMSPPALIPQRRPLPPPNAISTPNGKAQASNLPTPVQTPTISAPRRSALKQTVEGTANRHEERLRAIQEAQDAFHREQEAAQAAKAPSMASAPSASTSTVSPAAQPPQSKAPAAPLPPKTEFVDDDDFFPSEDDDFLANVDLDALDEGIGRPINFEEGMGAATELGGEDTARQSTTTPPDVGAPSRGSSRPAAAVSPPAPVPQQPPPKGANGVPSGSLNSGSRPQTSHPSRTQNLQNIPSARPLPNTTDTGHPPASEGPRTPSMGGGFSYPNGPQSTATAGSAPRATSSSKGSLKRTADIMQGINAGLAGRRPQQGMGLQNPPQGAKREPLGTLEHREGGDPKRQRL